MTTKIKRQIQRVSFTNFCCLLIVGLGVAPTSLLAWQVTSTCAADVEGTGHKVHAIKLAHLLQKPNALENAANLVGHFFVDDEIRPIMTFDLDGAIAGSSLIAVGTITAKSSELMEDGDDIFTKYAMHVNTLLKGSATANGDIAFFARGGCLAFANGTSAEISTIAWRYIEVGQQYLVFLRKTSPSEDTFSITGGIEGLGKPTSKNGGFELAADLDKDLHHIISDRTKAMTVLDLADKIKKH